MEKIFNHLFPFLLFFICGITPVFAFDPPTPSIATLLLEKKVVFVGRVIEVKELENDSYKSIARAKISVKKCLSEIECKEGDIFFIKYYSDTLEEGVMRLELPLSREVLFVLQELTVREEIFFDSRLVGGVDFAFFIDVEDISSNFQNQFLSASNKIRLTNSYWPKHREWIEKEKLISWGQGEQ